MGGGSAGGHISAVLSHMLVSNPQAPKDFALKLLLLVIVSPWRGDVMLEPELIRVQPTVDNTSGEPTPGSQTWNDYPSWTENKHAPMLDAAQVSTIASRSTIFSRVITTDPVVPQLVRP
jgi:hypothetical protein